MLMTPTALAATKTSRPVRDRFPDVVIGTCAILLIC